jgi:orotate phosphoribosyltransferase-like protein
LSRKEVIRRIIELRCRGYKISEIADELGVSDRTIIRIRVSDEYDKAVEEEIERMQLKDIDDADIKTRLHYRDRFLDKIKPKKIESKSEVGGSIVVKAYDLGNKG